MNLEKNIKHEILDDETKRYCEIYKITNIINKKIYIGQAVSHILNHKKYRPYGMEGRLRCHISEAFSSKKNQCHYLNNAIRKYGSQNFSLELITTCNISDANIIESEEILKNNSLYPNGYNLNKGGNSHIHTEESKKRVSSGVINYFKDKKSLRFNNIRIDDNCDINKYIRPLNRHNIQYGWYVYIQGKKADFGGSHISLEDSKKMALNFINCLMKAKHLDAGSSLEP
jgi:hypothetical protein